MIREQEGNSMYGKSYAELSEKEDLQEKKQCQVTPAMAMTVDELADELRISKPTAYRIVRQADFPSFCIGNRILVNRSGLQKWIDQKSSQPLGDVS